MDRNESVHMIGIYRDGNTFFLAKLARKTDTTPTLFSFSETHVKRLYSEAREDIATGLEAADVLIKHIQLKVPQKKALSQIAAYQMKSLHVLDEKEAITLPFIEKEEGKNTYTLTCFTTAKKSLKKHVKKWQQEGIDPSYVSSSSRALLRYAEKYGTAKNSMILLHLGLRKVTCVHVDKRRIKKARTLRLGLSDLLEKARTCGNAPLSSIQFETAALNPPSGKKQEIAETAAQMKAAIVQAIRSFSLDRALPLLLTGHGKLTPNFIDYVFGDAPDLIDQILPDSQQEKNAADLKKYAISIGLALDAAASDGTNLQFRTQEFTPKKWIQRRFWKMSASLMTLVIASIGSAVFARALIEEKQEKFLRALHTAYQKDCIESKRSNIPERVDRNAADFLHVWNETLDAEMPKKNSHLRKRNTGQAIKPLPIISWLHTLLSSKTEDVSIDSLSTSFTEDGLIQVLLSCEIPEDHVADLFKEKLLSSKQKVAVSKGISWKKTDPPKKLYQADFYLYPGGF